MEDKQNILDVDMSQIKDTWRNMASPERALLEDLYKKYNNRDKATAEVLQKWDMDFGGKQRKVTEIKTDQDVYNVLKDVYKNTNSMEEVVKVAKYNNIPEKTLNKFVKNGQLTDYNIGDEFGSGTGALARGATDNLYGGIANILTGGEYAKKYLDALPEGIDYEDAAHTLYRAGINQSKAYGKSLMEVAPEVEITGQLAGSLLPIGLASKATKGIKLANEATKLGRLANTGIRGATTGAIVSVPGSLSEDSLGGALENTLTDSLLFGAGDIGLKGAGAVLRGVGKGISGATGIVTKPSVHYREAFKKLKPLSEMTPEEIAIGKQKGWINNKGEFQAIKYLADEYGQNATEIMEDLWREARGNRETYNLLRKQIEHFNYKDAIKNAAKESLIQDANFSRVNKVLKEIPERLDKFSEEGAKWYESFSGDQLAQRMADFNLDVKNALNSIKNPTEIEQEAINNFLKKIDSSNMLQFMKRKMPSQFQAKDLDKSLFGEMANIFNINNPISQGSAVGKWIKNRANRNFMKQVLSGKTKEKNKTIKRLQDVAKSEKTADTIHNLNRSIIKTTKGVQ